MAGRASTIGASRARLARAATAALQGYADRGVFRGFSVTDAPRGDRRFEFLWLTRRPMVLRLSPARQLLVFERLFPAADRVPGVVEALRAAVRSASSVARPPHRRIDARRAKMTCRFHHGDGSLRLSFVGSARGAGDGAAVRASLGFVNELFLLLHECYPEYLIGQFGASAE